jgi:hypothetical protein
MNIAKNMESIFFIVVSIACTIVFLTTTAPVITVNVTGPSASHEEAMPSVTVIGKRLG